jgi:hypothetical protein
MSGRPGLKKLGEAMVCFGNKVKKENFNRDGKNVEDLESMVLIELWKAEPSELDPAACRNRRKANLAFLLLDRYSLQTYYLRYLLHPLYRILNKLLNWDSQHIGTFLDDFPVHTCSKCRRFPFLLH